MNKYFSTTIVPDLIQGDVSDIIQANGSDLPFGNGDILFDWHAFEVPKGTNRLENISMYLMGQDGGTQVLADVHLIFAKSINKEAPTSLGSVNGAQTAGFDMPTHFIGGTKLEGSGAAIGNLVGPAFGTVLISSSTNGHGHVNSGLILQGEPGSGKKYAYDIIYVAAFAGGSLDFSTGVLLNDGSDVADDAGTSLTVDGVDPRKCFQIGDTVYVHDVDTAIGTVASMTANTIVLAANNVGAIADDDELVNANPIRLVLGFSG